MKLSDKEIQGFLDDGYIIIKNFWPENLIDEWEKTIIGFYYQQALKITNVRAIFKKGSDPTKYNSVKDLDAVLEILEKEDTEAGFHATIMIENSAAHKKIFSYDNFLDVCSQLLKCPVNLLTFSAGTPFVNIPETKRLLYTWHSEASYYPRRKNLLNVWFPIFRDKKDNNGTMIFCKGSHKKPFWDFLEYKGYDDEIGKQNYHLQFAIPESFLDDYEQISVNAKRGDLVIFDRNLVHTSSLNTTKKISYATALRVCDMRYDLTLSGLMGTRPYTNDYGRPGIEPLM